MTVFSGVAPFPKKGSKKYRYPDVKFKASFYRQNGSLIVAEADSVKSRIGRTSSDVIACTTSKSIGNPIGSYSLTLVPRAADYFNKILPGDWCEIESDNGDGRGLRPVMYGPITDVRRRRTTDSRGTVMTRVMVRGSDFGRPFALTTAIYDAKLANDPAFSNLGLARLVSRLGTVSGSPGKIVDEIITIFLRTLVDANGDSVQWIDPKQGVTFGANDLERGYIKGFSFVTGDFDVPGDQLLGQAAAESIMLSGSLWQVLQQWANLGINEMFIDYRLPLGLTPDGFVSKDDQVNLVPALVLRQYPFFGPSWNDLTAVKVDRSEVTNDDMGRSDGDTRNWIRASDEPRLTGVRDGLTVHLDKVGTVNSESIKRFGFRRYENPTQFIFDPDSEEPKTIVDLVQTFSALQTLWHHSNERLINGTMELYHRPDIRIGYRLDYKDEEVDENLQFYVESVSHSLNFPGRSSTTVTLTRGRDPKDARFTDGLPTLIDEGVVSELGNTLSRLDTTLKGLLG